MSKELYCEICGRPIRGQGHRVLLDGVEVVLCDECFARLSKSGRVAPVPSKKVSVARGGRQPARPRQEQMELVDDYPDIVRRAREAMGWTQAALAQKLRVSEDLVRKIEQGKVKPTVELARRMESLLKVKLLQPVEVEEGEELPPADDKLTLGDVVVVRREKKG